MNDHQNIIGTFDLEDFTESLDNWQLEIHALLPNGSYLPIYTLQGAEFFGTDFYLPVIKILTKGHFSQAKDEPRP